MLDDPAIATATQEILPDKSVPRHEIQRMIKRKERAIEQLVRFLLFLLFILLFFHCQAYLGLMHAWVILVQEMKWRSVRIDGTGVSANVVSLWLFVLLSRWSVTATELCLQTLCGNAATLLATTTRKETDTRARNSRTIPIFNPELVRASCSNIHVYLGHTALVYNC